MPSFCTAYGCSNASYKLECINKISFHRFPLNDPNILKMWLIKIRRKDFHPNKYSRICSAHFEEDCFNIHKKGKRFLKPNAVPTKFSYKLEEKLQSQSSNNLSGTLDPNAKPTEISSINHVEQLCKVCDLPVSSGCHSELKQTWQMASVRLLVDQKLQAIDTKRKKSVLISEQQRQKGEVKKNDEQQLKLEKQSKKTEKTIEDENEDEINQLSNNAVLIQVGDVETILTEDTIDTDDVLTEKSTNEQLHSSKQLKIDSSSQRLKEEEEERISALKTRLMSTIVKRSLKSALLESEIKTANTRRDFYESKKSLLSLRSVASNTKTVPLSLTEQKILKDLKEEKSAFNIERSILQKQLVEAEKKAAISIKTYYEMKKSLLPTSNPCS